MLSGREDTEATASTASLGEKLPEYQSLKRERRKEVSTLLLRSRVLKFRCFRFSPQRGSRKSAQGQRPTGAPPWVPNVADFQALKGRPYGR